ncbi:hypothetical protein K0M31_000649 [Melipona bicolor]|uniref:Uncharacterized protein n=1 Tax=Melipona bicolor TaxID=60889 RepID=A0AA40GE60_9HYME|nr:hypothetical protein K0M31_000649 [Melipona bicolor]
MNMQRSASFRDRAKFPKQTRETIEAEKRGFLRIPEEIELILPEERKVAFVRAGELSIAFWIDLPRELNALTRNTMVEPEVSTLSKICNASANFLVKFMVMNLEQA